MVLSGRAQAGVMALGVVTLEAASAEAVVSETTGHRQHRRAALIQSIKRRAHILLWWMLVFGV